MAYSQIGTLYETYFGRAPSAGEISVWQGLIAGGNTFAQLQDTLERVTTSASVQHIVATGSAQAFTFPTSPSYLTIDHFNAQLDTITVGSQYNTAGGLLSAAHAQQITALDGTTDVLITLDASHSILLEHIQLSSLSSNDFLFG